MTTLTLTQPATTLAPVAVSPADLAPETRTLAESLWAQGNEDPANDDLLAALLGLGPGDGHDELTRCEHPGCDAWHYADCGAVVTYQSGRDLQMCPEHAVADDPGAVIYPGASLAAAWNNEIGA